MVRHLIDKIKGKIKRGITKGIFLASAGILFSGCPLPYPNYTNESTPEPTSGPTAEPTPEPTPDNDYLDISGRLEDCENDGIGREGIIKIYNATDDSLLDTYNVSGDFSVSLDKLNSQLPNGVKIKARIGSESSPTSYVRTINLPYGDQSDVLIRAVPYPDFDTNNDGVINQTDYQNFKSHVQETNGTYSKWDLDEFNKIKIFKQNGDYHFDDVAVGNIISKIEDSDNIEKFIEGRELDNRIEVIDGSPVEFWEDNCIYVVPNEKIPYGNVGVTYRSKEIRTIKKARIEMNSCATGIDNPVTTHEFGHAFIAPDGEARTIDEEQTILHTTGNVLLQPGIADNKARKLVYENTFNAGENPDKILGID